YFLQKQEEGRTVSTSDLDQFGMLIGSSKPMHKLYRTLRRVAKTDANVLIVGESGAGKELVAQTVHLASDRKNQPFIAINCGAISPELVDSELFGHEKGAF
ncbi:sigma 54-interacting transcriptional regulator, partial [Shigella sonnei]